MRRILTIGIVTLMALAVPVFAAEEANQSIVERAEQLKEPVPARTTMGEIREIDYGKRQAIIGGYLYDFGPPGLPLKFKLGGGDSGAFELLQPGMKVRVTYGELDTARIAVVIEEVPDADFIEY